MNLKHHSIGLLHSCFKEKFGIPRQSGLASHATAQLEFHPEYGSAEALRGLEQFSHLWIIFEFHACPEQQWRPTVRPPRLGGNQKIGVFASRSNFRPNRIGLSAVQLIKIEQRANTHWLHLSGGDFLDGTPVLDIKPYLPYSDSIEEAHGGFANNAPNNAHQIHFSPAAEHVMQSRGKKWPNLKALLEEVLQQDPRPAYRQAKADPREYSCHIYDFDLRWRVEENQVYVTSISPR
ncbi:MAG: tRNA (N6-threonylcarbamoyladenosine(37)-N6)-methyltransferase TrmO [Gammaproteobacteria bacterium]|nr:tRNA (N6-threonylcarbamoyladenosine(37)-N6)-methyltransferase TrmO [Gammaproteobacteria bacterium]